MLCPNLEVNLSGLETEAYYSVQLKFVNSDKYVYNYIPYTKEWKKSNASISTEKCSQATCHPDSPNTGKFWMSRPVSFNYVCLTTMSVTKNGYVREERTENIVGLLTHILCVYFTDSASLCS